MHMTAFLRCQAAGEAHNRKTGAALPGESRTWSSRRQPLAHPEHIVALKGRGLVRDPGDQPVTAIADDAVQRVEVNVVKALRLCLLDRGVRVSAPAAAASERQEYVCESLLPDILRDRGIRNTSDALPRLEVFKVVVERRRLVRQQRSRVSTQRGGQRRKNRIGIRPGSELIDREHAAQHRGQGNGCIGDCECPAGLDGWYRAYESRQRIAGQRRGKPPAERNMLEQAREDVYPGL